MPDNRFWPATEVTLKSLAILDREVAPFDVALRDQALSCRPPSPVQGPVQVVELQVEGSDVTLPLFQRPEAGELHYIELSLDKPGAPVVLHVTTYNGVALRVTPSPATKIVAVHVAGYYPSVVAGIAPERVSQSYLGDVAGRQCRYGEGLPSGFLPAGTEPAELYKASSRHQVAIGAAVPARREPPMLGNFLDLDLPVPHNYGIVTLVSLGYLKQVKLNGEPGGRGPVYSGLQVLKPFRLPRGLYGSHSVTLLVSPDGPVPSGDLGHSEMYRIPSRAQSPR